MASSKDEVANILNAALVKICLQAIEKRGIFTVALSGGSLPSFLSSVDEAFKAVGADPMYGRWHIILADERCVPSDDPENNLKAIKDNFLSKVSIPEAQVYGIDEAKLSESTESVANAYEEVVKFVIASSGGLLDLAVLGFGPDGKSMIATSLAATPRNALTFLSCIVLHRSHVFAFSGPPSADRNVKVGCAH